MLVCSRVMDDDRDFSQSVFALWKFACRFRLSETVAYDGLRRWLGRYCEDSLDRVKRVKARILTCFLRVNHEPLEILEKDLRSQPASSYIAIAILARASSLASPYCRKRFTHYSRGQVYILFVSYRVVSCRDFKRSRSSYLCVLHIAHSECQRLTQVS